MIKFFGGAISVFLGVALLVIVISVIGVHDILKRFFEFSPWGIIPLIFFTVVSNILDTARWQYILRVMGVRIRFFPLFMADLAGYAASYVTPVVYLGGEIIRGHILADRHKIPWRKGMASIAIDKTVESSVWLLAVFVGVNIFLVRAGASSFSKSISLSIAFLVFLGILTVAVYIFSFSKKSLVRLVLKPLGLLESRGGRFLGEIEDEFFKFFSFRNKKCLLAAFALAVLKYMFLWLRNVFLIYFLIRVFAFSDGIVALAFTYVAYSLPIPAALGAHEAILSLIFAGMGAGADTGAVFTLLLRGADMLLVGTGLFFLARWGFSKFAFRNAKRL